MKKVPMYPTFDKAKQTGTFDILQHKENMKINVAWGNRVSSPSPECSYRQARKA